MTCALKSRVDLVEEVDAVEGLVAGARGDGRKSLGAEAEGGAHHALEGSIGLGLALVEALDGFAAAGLGDEVEHREEDGGDGEAEKRGEEPKRHDLMCGGVGNDAGDDEVVEPGFEFCDILEERRDPEGRTDGDPEQDPGFLLTGFTQLLG